MSPWRAFLMVFVFVYQACGNEDTISGLRGQSVTLKSGADQSRSLTKVQWSIYLNTTFIAGLKDGKFIDYEFWRYRGRLEISTVTGDLTIRDVTVNDSMTYDVNVVYKDDSRRQAKVHLKVQEPLKEPEIQQMFNSLKDGQCYVALRCIVFGGNVNLSWTSESNFNGSYISGRLNSEDVLFAEFSRDQNVTFSCSASSGQQTETKQISVGCSEEIQKCEASSVCSLRCSCISSVVLTLFFTLVIVLIAFMYREKIQALFTRFLDYIWSGRTVSASPGVQGKQETESEEEQTSKPPI